MANGETPILHSPCSYNQAMNNKTIKIIVIGVLGGLLLAFLLDYSFGVFNRWQTAHTPNHSNQKINLIANNNINITCPPEMVAIPGGTFTMGSNDGYEEEELVKDVTIKSFCMDKYEVTNAQFAQFVKATGYVTMAEHPLPPESFPNLSEAQRKPGSLVFQQPSGNQPIPELSWWHWVAGANWRHPDGPNSNIEGKENYPVVHIAYQDAEAYVKWAGKSLPTEAQWEFAAQGGLVNAIYTWGNEYSATKANTWQGEFPLENTKEDKYIGTAPVGSFPANGYGLYDIAGNVWEWTNDWYRIGHEGKSHQTNPTVSNPNESFDPREPGTAKHVIKGGSYLCAPNYCSRYRPAGREAQSPDTGTSHIGFRLVKVPG